MAVDRRKVLGALGAGAAGTVFGRALSALAAEGGAVTPETIQKAEWIAGVSFTDAERELMRKDVESAVAAAAELRKVPLDNAVPPALRFEPLAARARPEAEGSAPEAPRPVSRPSGDEALAFSSVRELGALLRGRHVSSVELTRLYLARIGRLDPLLSAVVTVTGELALKQAEAADRELASGKDRGPLHGIPWGAKDLVAVPGFPTTWGTGPFRSQVRPETATVAARLFAAGAVLVAKTSVGELAWGDVWFGGTTKNPWKTDQGSSGSSAGSASGTAAGLYPFAIGTETWGSIVSPCTRCGATGLRPTFGRVSRHGVMSLAFSMDKVGAIARSADDCALVFSAIHGADPEDPGAVTRPFSWPPRGDARKLRVGFVPELFEEERGKEAKSAADKAAAAEWRAHDLATLDVLKRLGVSLVPLELPRTPVRPLSGILTVEAAAAFDEMVASGAVNGMVRQTADAWPNVFRHGRLVSGVAYLRAQRVRTLLMREMERRLEGLDLYVAPTFGGNRLLLENLTGHPAVVVPNGFRSGDGTPTSITFTGQLFGEGALLALAQLYQRETGFHLRHPDLRTAR